MTKTRTSKLPRQSSILSIQGGSVRDRVERVLQPHRQWDRHKELYLLGRIIHVVFSFPTNTFYTSPWSWNFQSKPNRAMMTNWLIRWDMHFVQVLIKMSYPWHLKPCCRRCIIYCIWSSLYMVGLFTHTRLTLIILSSSEWSKETNCSPIIAPPKYLILGYKYLFSQFSTCLSWSKRQHNEAHEKLVGTLKASH